MRKKSVYVMSIAGFDPSGGAGVLADIKTFDHHKVYGFGVCSALTIQNEIEVKSVEWIPVDKILYQITTLFETHKISHVKIGIIESAEVLKQVCELLKKLNPSVKIIWDPVFKASSGFSFYSLTSENSISEIKKKFEALLPFIYMVTPNKTEFEQVYGEKSLEEVVKTLPPEIMIYLKGGHDENNLGKDHLLQGESIFGLNPKKGNYFPKHGSGCVLSSALCANLAKGYPVMKVCLKSKRYIEHHLSKTKELLA